MAKGRFKWPIEFKKIIFQFRDRKQYRTPEHCGLWQRGPRLIVRDPDPKNINKKCTDILC